MSGSKEKSDRSTASARDHRPRSSTARNADGSGERRGSSITVKFGLLAGTLVVWFVLFGVMVWMQLDEVWQSVGHITETVEPRSAAAYEMEINAIGTSLAIVKYLRSPNPAYVARFEDDTADFWTFYRQYEALARTGAERDLAEKIASQFQDLHALGRQIVIQKDEEVAAIKRLTRTVREIEEVTETAPTSAEIAGRALSSPVVMKQVNTAMDEIAEILAVAAWSSQDRSANQIERMTATVRASISRLAAQELAPSEAEIASRLSTAFAKFEDGLAGFLQQERLLDRNFERLVALRKELDHVLDEEIQALTAKDMARAHSVIDRDVSVAFSGITVLGIGGLAILALTMALLSTVVVLPIRRLAETATAFGRGELGRRIGSSRRDEIGALAQALDDMAQNVQEAQQVLERSNAELEVMVAERTQQLVSVNRDLEEELAARKVMLRKLRETTKLAEAASRAKTAFLANMSHELRTPLNGILGVAEMIQMKIYGPLGDARYEEYLQDILDSGRHLLKQVDDVLEVSNIELEQPNIRPAKMDLGEVARRSLALAARPAERKNLAVETVVPTNLPRVWADESRVEQVLNNLIDNAVKFSPEGSKLVVSLRHENDDSVAVSISDQGPGMSQDQIGSALAFFGTVDPLCADHDRGLGLGLSLSKRLVEMQDGTLSVETAPGRGTTVTVRLPCRPFADREMAVRMSTS